MMIAIESEGLFRTFMEFIFVLFLRVCGVTQDGLCFPPFFDELLGCCRQCLGRERRGVCFIIGGILASLFGFN